MNVLYPVLVFLGVVLWGVVHSLTASVWAKARAGQRWVRHPLYTVGLIFIWLLTEMTVNRLALNIGLSLYLVVGALYEERKLVLEFGQAYQEYREQTPMLIPWRKPA